MTTTIPGSFLSPATRRKPWTGQALDRASPGQGKAFEIQAYIHSIFGPGYWHGFHAWLIARGVSPRRANQRRTAALSECADR